MQEDIDSRTVTLIINSSKLTERVLKQAIVKSFGLVKQRAAHPHGKMSVKKLAAQNKGMQSIEITDGNIGSFNRVARKYGIDFAPFKVKGEDKWLVFFKAPDTDAMTSAFQEYTAREMNRSKRPSVLEKLQKLQEAIIKPVRSRVKHKEATR